MKVLAHDAEFAAYSVVFGVSDFVGLSGELKSKLINPVGLEVLVHEDGVIAV